MITDPGVTPKTKRMEPMFVMYEAQSWIPGFPRLQTLTCQVHNVRSDHWAPEHPW